MPGLELVPADRGRARDEFLEVPFALYRDDPAFVPPLRLERKEFLDPAKNAFFRHAEVALVLARRGGRAVGRISLQVDREEERVLGVAGATFGLFEAADEAAAAALLAHAEAWARARARVRLRGPFSLSINQETGLVVDGFGVEPMLMMPQTRPEYPGFLEAAGFAKAKDMHAWRLSAAPIPEAFERAAAKARATPGLAVRPIDLGRLPAELEKVRSVFNSAWSANWGFIPMTDAELEAMARDLKLIVDPRIALIAEVAGQPVGIAIALPNLNEALRGLSGRLLPLGWAKLLWRLKVRGLGTARLALFGITEGSRGVRGLGMSALLLTEVHRRAVAAGYTEWELSWVLEDNRFANQALAMMGARRAKTYRVYEKAILPA